MSVRAPFVLLLIAAGAPLAPAEESDLLDQSVKRHTASLAAISSLSAKVVLESELAENANVPEAVRPKDGSRKLPAHRGEYSRSGLRVRVVETESPLGHRTLLRDYGTKTGQSRPQAGTSGGFKGGLMKPPVSAGPAWTTFSHLDISEGYLFALPHPVPPDYDVGVTLAQLVATARSATAKREILDGVETVRIDVVSDGEGNGFQIWLDVNTNYLYRRIINLGPKGPRLEIRITEYAEPKPGIFCPIRAEKTIPKATRSVLTLSEVRINEPIPEGVFSTALPKGTQTLDHAEGKLYEVGSSGQPEKVVARLIEPNPVNSSDPPTISAPTPLLADEPQPLSWSRILLISSLAFALVGGVIWYRKRRVA